MFSVCLVWEVLSSRTSRRCHGDCETQPESRFPLFPKPHAVGSVEIPVSAPSFLMLWGNSWKITRTEGPVWMPRGDFPAKSWEFSTKVRGREETCEGLGINPVYPRLRFQKHSPCPPKIQPLSALLLCDLQESLNLSELLWYNGAMQIHPAESM